MADGIFIVGNDRYGAEVRALVNSIRCFDSEVDICLIPYDDDYQDIARWLHTRHRVGCFPDNDLLERISTALDTWFDYPGAPVQRDKRNRLRNLAAWCGPFDRFICMDADILVFEPIIQWCRHLETCDFLVCDDMYRHGGKWVFNSDVTRLAPAIPVHSVFNGGMWGSSRDFMSGENILDVINECAHYRECFDFASGALAQPLLNFIVLSRTPNLRNLVKEDAGIRVWVGDHDLSARDHAIWHQDRRCPFIHWAGKKIEPGKYFHDTWRHYHDLVA